MKYVNPRITVELKNVHFDVFLQKIVSQCPHMKGIFHTRLTRGERPALGIFVRWKSGFFISNFHFSFFKISKRRSTFFRKFSIFVNSTFCATQSRFLATLRDITQLPNTFPTDSDGFSAFQKSISTIFR